MLVQQAVSAPAADSRAAVAAARQAVVNRLASQQSSSTAGGRTGSKLATQDLEALLVGLSALDRGSVSPPELVGGAVGGLPGATTSPVGDAGPILGDATVLTPPAPVISLFAQQPKALALSLAWTLEDTDVPRSTGFKVNLFEGATPSDTPLSSLELGPEARTAVIPAPARPDIPQLLAGRTYVATVTAHYSTLAGTVTVDRESSPSRPVTLVDPKATEPLPRLGPDPLPLTSISPEGRRVAAQALTMGGRWRSQHLLKQAMTIVEHATA